MTDITPGNVKPVDRGELLHLLDSEIEYARSEATRGGWTSWALAAAGVALAAFGLDEWRGDRTTVDDLAKWVIALSIPMDAFATVTFQWSQQRRAKQALTFQFSSEWEPLRFAALFWLVRCLAMVILVVKGGDQVAWPATLAAVIYYLLIAFAAGSMFGTSFMDMPVPIKKNIRKRSTVIGGGIVWGIFGFVAWSFISSIPYTPPGSDVSHIAIAAVIVLEQIIVFRILYNLRQSPLEDRLVDVRRDLVLTRVDLPFAARSTEVTLLGIDGRTVIEEYLLRTIDAISRFRTAAGHARLAAIDAIGHANVLQSTTGTLSNEERKKKLAELRRLENRSKELTKSAIREARRIRSRSSGFNDLIKKVREETPALLEDLSETSLPTIAGQVEKANEIFEADAGNLDEVARLVRDRCSSARLAAAISGAEPPA